MQEIQDMLQLEHAITTMIARAILSFVSEGYVRMFTNQTRMLQGNSNQVSSIKKVEHKKKLNFHRNTTMFEI